MDSSIHQKIKIEYDNRRRNAYTELEIRKSDLYYRIPRLEEIEDEIRRAGLKYNKMILANLLSSDGSAQELSKTIDLLKEEKVRLLVRYGYSPDYLNPVYTCEKCCDTGIIRSATNTIDTVCACYKQQLIDYIYDQSNLAIADNAGFKSFNADYYSDIPNEEKYKVKNSPRQLILDLLENCRRFVDHFDKAEIKNMLFCGPTGVGKTYMAGSIAIELMNRGYTVIYQTAPALFNIIYEYRYKSSNDDIYENSIYKSILEADLLIIDDLGTESPSAMRYAELLSIIDTRNSNDKKKHCKTIIATNIHPKQLFNYYDERVVSRIMGSYDLFWFAGDDIRGIKKTT